MSRTNSHTERQRFLAEQRRQRVLTGIKEGKSLHTIATEVGSAYSTIRLDKEKLMELARNENKNAMELHRDDQLTRIQQKWGEIESDESMTGAEKHLAWSRWMKLEMDLRGTAAPTKSISANVNVDAENIGPYRKFVLAVAGLDESQIEHLLLMAREIPRKPFVMVQPPKTSPLWTKNQLTEGDDEVA